MKFIIFIFLTFTLQAQHSKKISKSKDLVTTGILHANNVKAIVANNGWLFWGGGASGFIIPSPVFSENEGNVSWALSNYPELELCYQVS